MLNVWSALLKISLFKTSFYIFLFFEIGDSFRCYQMTESIT